MNRAFLTRALVAGVLAMPPIVTAGSSAATVQGAQATAAQAAPFLGDWTLTMQGPNGPGTFALSLKTEKDKVTGEISSDQLPKQPITGISSVDKSLVLNYSFTWEGNPVEAVVTLAPAADGKTTAQIDFAGGAYVMTGEATRKDKPKAD
jgi:hypothetical protein